MTLLFEVIGDFIFSLFGPSSWGGKKVSVPRESWKVRAWRRRQAREEARKER